MVAFGVILLALGLVHEPTFPEVVAYGRALDVSRIDSRLGSGRYDAWLAKTLGPDTTITWDSDACGEGGKGYGNVPVCVTVEATLRPRGRVVISIEVGSARGGLGREPTLYFGMIEGLGPREPVEAGEMPHLASKIRTAQAHADEMSRLPDVSPDDDGWIRQVQRTPAARLVAHASRGVAFGDWVAAHANLGSKVEWFVEGCGPRGRHDGPRVNLTGDKDEWAFVAADFETPDVHVLARVKVGTCRKGMLGSPTAVKARLRDKQPHYADTEEVSLDALEAGIIAVRKRRPPTTTTKENH
jgi:hypothetical protein